MQGYCRVTPAAFPPGDHSLPTPIGLWSAVLRRSRADLPVVLASFALLASALSLLAAGTLYTSAVTLAGLQRALLAAPAADRAIVVRTKILPERLQAADAVIVPQLQESIADTGGELAFVLHSPAYADAASDPATVSDLTQFASFQGIDRHAELVDGQWATPGHDPIEATLSQGAAAALGVGTGDHLSLVSRLDPTHKVDVAITGTWRPNPSDGYWLADPLDLDGTDKGGQFTTRGPLVVDQADLTDGPLSEALDAQWRAIPDVGGFRPESLDTVATNVDGLLARVNAALPGTNQASISTKLPAILSSIDRSVLVAQAGILLLLVQFGVLAAYAVILVAALLLERRRTETALLRSRGAGTGHLASMAFGEALIVVVPAVIVAPWLAMLLVQAVRLNPAMEGVGLSAPLPGPATFLTAIGGGLIALVALTIPTLASGVSIAGVRAAVGRQAGRTLPQRLGLDLALVVLAVIAILQLRLYGATLTRNTRGTLGVDPLLVAAPAIGLAAGAVLAIRIVPRLAELGERALARTRGLIGSLGSRQVARRPLRYTRAALLLILAAALGTFASAHAATWTQSQADQAAWTAGADVRIEPSATGDVPAWALDRSLKAIPGVTAVTPVSNAAVDIGATIRGGNLVALDGAEMADVVRLRKDAAGAATVAALQEMGARRPTVPGIALPDGTKRLVVSADSHFTPVEGFEPIPDGYKGLTAAALLVDGNGRIVKFTSNPGAIGVDGTQLDIPLTGAGGQALEGPVHLIGLDVGLTIAGVPNGMGQGQIDVTSLASSPDVDGGTVTPLEIAPGGHWTQDEGGNRTPLKPTAGPKITLPVISISQFFDDLWTLSYLPARDAAPLPTIAGSSFLAKTGASVGSKLHASVFGVPVTLDIIAKVDGFPPLDQTKPFVLVDDLALGLARAGRAARSSTPTPGGCRSIRRRRLRSTRPCGRRPSKRRRSWTGRWWRPTSRATRSGSGSSASSGSGRWRPWCSRRSASS